MSFVVVLMVLSNQTFAESGTLRLNEFLALNQSGLMDEDGDYSDWIEIYNPGPEDVNLLNWSLTDDESLPTKYPLPAVILESESYMLVFVSGKNRNNPERELHANFRLSGAGEFLGFYNPDGVAIKEFKPSFPAQQADVSHGYYEGTYINFIDPSPGADNMQSKLKQLPAPIFSINHGFFDAAFNLDISCSANTSKIYYTLDGSVPSLTNGTLYEQSLTISKTTILRAFAILSGSVSSQVSTQTYLFPNDIVTQSNSPAGYPAAWGSYARISGNAIADYEMDPDLISNPVFAAKVKEALKDIPTISLVTDKDHFFNNVDDEDVGGIYMFTGPPTGGSGAGWERPVSFEYFDAIDSVSLQVDCGVRLHGGHSRLPEKSPKHSFRLVFRGEYGATKLNFPFFGEDAASKINTLVLRAGFCNAWIHHSADQRNIAQFTRDAWTKDTQKKMGHIATNNNFAHLYLNGIYWGLFNPTERTDGEFGEAYLKGDADDFDVIKDYTEVAEGTIDAWNRMMALARSGMASNTTYQKIQGNNPDGSPNESYENLLDVVNLIDYMIINMYGGNTDWDHHNWAAIRNRLKPEEGFKFVCWDSEHVLKKTGENVTKEDNDNCPSELFQLLKKNEDFRKLVADRVQKHCFNNGILTPEMSANTWIVREKEVNKSIDAEAARWGDYRRDVHPYQTSGPFALYTKDNQYMAQQAFMLNTYFPQRTTNFVNQMRSVGLFSVVSSPSFAINNKEITESIISVGDELSMSASKGTIYYTLDGSDPITSTPGTTSQAYASPITLNYSKHVKARTFYNGEWSAVNDMFLTIPNDFNDLKVTEVHYHPLADASGNENGYEFLEIKNTGQAVLNLRDASFGDGIDFEFDKETEIQPGAFIVLAGNEDMFHSRYGFWPFDEYKGQLDNSGEWIKLVSPLNDTICNFKFNDGVGWPQTPDGEGNSLVPTEYNPTNDQTIPPYWRASHFVGGSPGKDDIPETAIRKIASVDLGKVVLGQNYPNPFVSITYIDFSLPVDADVQLDILDVMGRKVASLVDEHRAAGLHQMEWDASNFDSGLFFCRLIVKTGHSEYLVTKKMIKN